MKLAVSNIAWASPETAMIYRLLQRLDVTALEAAPGILFPEASDPLAPPASAIVEAHALARSHGLRFVSLQAVHFGRDRDQLFGDRVARQSFIAAIAAAIRLAAELGVGNIVLGSPRSRIRPDAMSVAAAFEIAADALRPLGDVARAHGVTISIEANPSIYGGNFVTHLADAVSLCDRIGHPAFGVNLDLGERIINTDTSAAAAAPLVTHMQISAPHLAPPLGMHDVVSGLLAMLDRAGFEGWTSIEMRRADDSGAALERVIGEAAAALRAVDSAA